MDIIPSDLATFGNEAKELVAGLTEPQRANVSPYISLVGKTWQTRSGNWQNDNFRCGGYRTEIQLPPDTP